MTEWNETIQKLEEERTKAPPMQGDEIEALVPCMDDWCHPGTPCKCREALTAAEARGYERGLADRTARRGFSDPAFEQGKLSEWDQAFTAGFLRCREEAAKVAETYGENSMFCFHKYIAALIRSLKP